MAKTSVTMAALDFGSKKNKTIRSAVKHITFMLLS
jgi:hypothetical protein